MWTPDKDTKAMGLASDMDEMIALGWTLDTFDEDFDNCTSDTWSAEDKEICREMFEYLWDERFN